MSYSVPLKVLWSLIFLWINFTLTAQICTGNLGDNIFEDGDFGAGAENNVRLDPGIAPGYRYTSIGPPQDGLYTITNNTGLWRNLYPTWLAIQDNSDDPNGYMMVVNASFSTGAFYEKVIEGLCENTLYVFSADIINIVKRNTLGHILPNVSFLLDDEVKYSTGEISQSEQWITYGFTFTTPPGKTSIKLTLRNNAPGGNGNDLALDNITFRACGPNALILPRDIANICEDGEPINLNATIVGEQFPTPALQWQQSFDEGITWENMIDENDNSYAHRELSSGFYFYRYLLAGTPNNIENGKCRVNSNIKVVHVVPKEYTIIDTLCEGLNFSVGDSRYNRTGIYTDSLISSLGCDSIVTLNLTIVPDNGITATTQTNAPICFGDANASIQVNNLQNGYPPYEIKLSTNQQINEANFQNLMAGQYLVEVRDRFGCNLQIELPIVAPEPFRINLGNDQVIDLGDAMSLSLDTNYPIGRLNWLSELVKCAGDCLNELIYPKASGVYAVEATSEVGCITQDSVFIEVLPVRKIYVPSAFSPNDDGINDWFTIYGSQPNVERVMQLQIFDRWGNLLFTKNDFQPNNERLGWNGTFQQKRLSQGSYVFRAQVLYFDEVMEEIVGDVLLLQSEK